MSISPFYRQYSDIRARIAPFRLKTDYIHDFVVATYQSFGLDKKTPEQSSDVFFGDP